MHRKELFDNSTIIYKITFFQINSLHELKMPNQLKNLKVSYVSSVFRGWRNVENKPSTVTESAPWLTCLIQAVLYLLKVSLTFIDCFTFTDEQRQRTQNSSETQRCGVIHWRSTGWRHQITQQESSKKDSWREADQWVAWRWRWRKPGKLCICLILQ